MKCGCGIKFKQSTTYIYYILYRTPKSYLALEQRERRDHGMLHTTYHRVAI